VRLPVCLNVALCASGEGLLKRSFDEHFTQLRPLVLQRRKGYIGIRMGGSDQCGPGQNGGWGSSSLSQARNDFDIPLPGLPSCEASFVSGQRDLNSIKMRQRRGNNADKLASGPWFFLYVSCCQFPP